MTFVLSYLSQKKVQNTTEIEIKEIYVFHSDFAFLAIFLRGKLFLYYISYFRYIFVYFLNINKE